MCARRRSANDTLAMPVSRLGRESWRYPQLDQQPRQDWRHCFTFTFWASLLSTFASADALASEILLSRRDCFVKWPVATGAAITAGHFATLAKAVESQPGDDMALAGLQRECAGTGLAVEQAIPGAYHQACMSLPVRSVPIRTRRARVASSDGTNGANADTATSLASLTDHVHVLEIQQTYAGSANSGSLAGSTGTVIWNSSLLLTRLLERLACLESTCNLFRNEVQDGYTFDVEPLSLPPTVMELGCGTGLVSLAAASLGATRVLATDGNPAVVQLAASNIERNHVTDRVRAVHLPWGLLAAMDYSETADLVLGSDLTYFSGNWPALAATMSTVLKPEGVVLYLSMGHSGFNVQAELDGFLSVASGFGLVPQTGGTLWTEQELTRILVQECLTREEASMIQSNGGLRVVALRYKG
jgi:SAM-dependent methyltransferase